MKAVIIQINMHTIWMGLSFWSNFKTVGIITEKVKNQKGLNNQPQVALHPTFLSLQTPPVFRGFCFSYSFLSFFFVYKSLPFRFYIFLVSHGFLSFPLYSYLFFPISHPFSLSFSSLSLVIYFLFWIFLGVFSFNFLCKCLESEDLELFGSDPFEFLENLRIWVLGLKLEILEKIIIIGLF